MRKKKKDPLAFPGWKRVRSREHGNSYSRYCAKTDYFCEVRQLAEDDWCYSIEAGPSDIPARDSRMSYRTAKAAIIAAEKDLSRTVKAHVKDLGRFVATLKHL